VAGRARQLCPGTSDVDLLCDVKGVVDLNAEIPHRAFDPPVAERLGFILRISISLKVKDPLFAVRC
jgi:hypothetical protein